MGSEEDSLPIARVPRQPRLLPRAGRVPPHWARGRSPLRGGRGHRRIPVPIPRRSGPGRGVGCSPEGFWGVQDGGAAGYQNGGGTEWNSSFVEAQYQSPQGGQRRAEGPIRGHSVPDPYHGASRRNDEGWEEVLPPVSSSYSLPELPHLSEDERQSIMEVIRRDEHLRRQDELRVMRLKAELQFLRRKGALRADWDPTAQTGGSPGIGGGGGVLVVGGGGGIGIGGGGGNGGGRACARCRAELGRIINRGAFCRACRLRVCKACREYNVRATDWVCSVCHKHMEIQVATGEWMNEFVRRPSRRRDNRVYVPAADIVKRSIRRSWTISTSHRRSFGGPQGSPELRAYSSLPRGASYLPAAAAEAAADAADAAADARRSTDNRETTPHRRLPAHPLLSLLRRGSSGGSDEVVPSRKSSSLDEEVTSGTLARDDSVFVEKHQDTASTSPGKKALGRKGVSLRRQQAVCTGSTGSTGAESSGGESPGLAPKSPRSPKSPRDKEPGKAASKEEEVKPKKKKGEDVVGEKGGGGRRGGEAEDEDDAEEEPVEDFDVEPISGTIFRKVTIRKKKKKKSVEDEEVVTAECDDSGVGGDARTTTPSSASPTVAPSPSLVRYEKQLQQPAELSRRLGAQESTEGGGPPAAAALLLDYVLDEGKIQPDGEDYKLVFISSDSSSKASTTNSDEEAPADEDCDWDYFEPARAVVVREIGGVVGVVGGEVVVEGVAEGVVGVPPPSLPPSAPGLTPSPPQLRPTPTPSSPPSPEVSKLLPATQSGAVKATAPPPSPPQHHLRHHHLTKGAAAGELLPREPAGAEGAGEGVVALTTDHIFFVEPMPAAEGGGGGDLEGQAGVEGGLSVSRRRRRARRVGRSRSETDLARLHLRLAPLPDDARCLGERSSSGGFVIDEGPTILAAGEFGPAGTMEGTGIRMWTVERDTDEYGPAGKRTIIPVPVPVPVPAWPARFHHEKGEEADGTTTAHTLPRGSMGDAVSVADIVYLGPAGSNAVRIRIRSFQRSSSASHDATGASSSSSQPHSSVSHVSVVGSASPSPSSWYAWHRVLDAPSSPSSSSTPCQHAFTSSVTLSSPSLHDCYVGVGGAGVGEPRAVGLKEIIEINRAQSSDEAESLCHPIEEEKPSEVCGSGTIAASRVSRCPSEEAVSIEAGPGGAETGAEGEGKESEAIAGAAVEGEPSGDATTNATSAAEIESIEPEAVEKDAIECFETNFVSSEDDARVTVEVSSSSFSPGAKGELLLSVESSKCESVTEIVSGEESRGGEWEAEKDEGVGGEGEGDGAESGAEEIGREETSGEVEKVIPTGSEGEEETRAEVDEEKETAREEDNNQVSKDDLSAGEVDISEDNEAETVETQSTVSSAECNLRDGIGKETAGDGNGTADVPREGDEKSDCDKEGEEEEEIDPEEGIDKGDETEGDGDKEEESGVAEEAEETAAPEGKEEERGAGEAKEEREKVDGREEAISDEPADEVVEKEECRRSDARVGEESAAADEEETRNAITEEVEVEITDGEGFYKGTEALEGGSEEVLIEAAANGDAGGEGMDLEGGGDKTEERIAEIGCSDTGDNAGDEAAEVGNATCSTAVDPKEDSTGDPVEVGGLSAEEGEGDAKTREDGTDCLTSEEMDGYEGEDEGEAIRDGEPSRKESEEEGEEETDGTVVLLSYRPLFEAGEERDEKVGVEGAWADGGSRPQPSHTPGAREISREVVGALSTVGGVAPEEEVKEVWEGKEVGLPRPPTSTRETAEEEGEAVEEDGSRKEEVGEGVEGGEAAESSGTSRSVVQEIRRGVDTGERAEESALPSPEKEEEEEECQEVGAGGGGGGGRVRRGKRKRNRKRKRRRGKQRGGSKEEEVVVVVSVPKEGTPAAEECVPQPTPAMDGDGSDEESVAAPDSDEYETSSGEFDLASGRRWAYLMTPPSVSSNSVSAGVSEESDSDDENFSRVFVVNPADDEEDEGVGRERREEDEEEEEEEEGRGGEVIADEVGVVVKEAEGAVIPYGGAGVRLMHIRALTDDDHVTAPRSKDVVVGDAAVAEQDGRRASSPSSSDIPSEEEDSVGGSDGSGDLRLSDKSSVEDEKENPDAEEIADERNENVTISPENREVEISVLKRDDRHEIDKPDGTDSNSTGVLDKWEEVQAVVRDSGGREEEGGIREDGVASGDKEAATPFDQSDAGDAKCREGSENSSDVVGGVEAVSSKEIIAELREDGCCGESAVAMATESDAAPRVEEEAIGEEEGGRDGGESRDSGSGESEPEGGEKGGGGVEDGGRLADSPSDEGEEDSASGKKCNGDADYSGCDVAGDGVVVGGIGVVVVGDPGLTVDVEKFDEVIASGGEDVEECHKEEEEVVSEVGGVIRVGDDVSDNISSDSSCEEGRKTEVVDKGVDRDDVSPPAVRDAAGGGFAGGEGGDGVVSGCNMLQDPPSLSGDPSCGDVVVAVAEEVEVDEEESRKPPQQGDQTAVVEVELVSDAEAEGERIPTAASETRETELEEGEGRQVEDRISPQFHAKATAGQVSPPHDESNEGVREVKEEETHSSSEEEEEDSTTPAPKTEESGPPQVEEGGGGASGDGSEMAPESDGVVGCGSSEVVGAEEMGGGEGPEVTVGEEETDPVPAGEPADPAAAATPASSSSTSSTPPPPPPSSPAPMPRRLSLPSTPSPPGENGREEGSTSVDAWKAPREDEGCYTGGGSLRWRSVGGSGRAGEGRCVSLEDILNPEANARPFVTSAGDSTVTTGGGGGVYTSYVMITQDGGVAREGLRRECVVLGREEEESEEGTEEGAGERQNGEDGASGRHQRVNVSVVEVSVVTSETTTLVSEEEEEEEEEQEEDMEDGECEVSSDEGGVVLKHANWGEEENNGNTGLAGYFTLTLETGAASPTPPRRPEIKSRKTIQLKDPSGPGDGFVDIPICGGELSGGEISGESDEGRNGDEDAVKVVTGGDTLSAVVCLEEGLADDDSWVEEVDATVDDIRDDEEDELGSESASSGDEAYFDREEELRGYNRAIDFTLHTILEESGEESEAENHQSSSQLNACQQTQGMKHRTSASNAEADASELEKYYFFGLGGIGGNAQEDPNDDLKYANEESEISDTVSETSCSSIYSEGLESLGVAGAPGHDGISETADSIMGMDPADLASSRLEKYFLTGFLGLEPPRGLRAPLGDEDGFSENTDESGSVGSDSEGRRSPEHRRKKLVRARGAGRQHHNSGGSGGGAASDAEAATGSPSGGESSSQVTHTHSQVHHQQQQKLLGQLQQSQQQQQQQQSQNNGLDPAEGEDSSTGSDSFDETAFEKGDGQFDTVKRKKKKRKENRHQEGETKEDGVAVSGDDLDGSKTPQPDLETVAEEEEETAEMAGGGERRVRGDEAYVAALEAENGMGPGGQGGRKQASRDSGFIGSCDDLLKDQQQQRTSDGEQRSSGSDRDSKKGILKDNNEEMAVNEDALKIGGDGKTQVPNDGDSKPALDVIGETEVAPLPALRPVPSGSPASISRTSLTRKDSFNNWSSDEETNLMMSKMRAFFKTMVAGKMASAQSSGLRRSNSGRQGSSGGEAHSASSSTNGDIPEPAEKVKPPQLVYFENELTRLMKTVPGIRDEQVREIVEYLSSEDTWSDSYDSSDYTSSDLEGAGMCYHGRGPSGPLRTELQQQISASCQQIIRNFDTCTDEVEEEENFGRPKSATAPASDAMNRETAFVYQRLVASFGKVAGGVGEPSSSDASSTPHSSPPLIAKVMHHIGGRLVALMHEVSAAGSGESGPLASSSSSPNNTPFTRNLNAAGSPKTGNNQVAAAMAARYRRLLRREAAAAAKDDKGSVTSTSVESECPSTDTEERSVDSDADSSSSSPPPMSRLPSLPRSKSHDLGQWQRLLLTGEENRRVSAGHSYYYGVSGVGSSAVGGGVVGPGTMMTSSGVHPGGVGGRDNKESLRSSSSGVSDLAEEREEYERLSWRGSFESALAADSRTKLSLEAKRRSAGSGSGSASDLCSSNDQLDHRGRVRSCGSITSAGSRGSLLQQQQLGARARLSASGGDLLAYRSSASRGTVAEEHEGEGDDEGDGDVVGSTGALSRRRRSVPDARGPPGERSTTLPRSNTAVSASTNSLPRLPTVSAPPHGTAAAAIHKSQSLMGHHLQQAHQQQQQQQPHHHHHLFLQNVKSARYRPPGFRPPPVPPVPPKRAVSVPGLNHQNRGRGERRRQSSGDDAISISETIGKGSSQVTGTTTPTAGSAPPTPGGGKKVSTGSSIGSWTNSPPTSPAVIAGGHNATEDDQTNERIPNIHPQTSTLSSLGLRSDSMASVYSGAGEGRYGTVAVRGEVEFALQYNYKQGALEILVKQCRELAPVDTKRNRSDPYVKVYLLPDKSKSGKRKTKVKKHTLNPVFDETLKFHITLNGLETRTLWLTVWHSDMFGRNDFLGEVMMSLENKVFDDPSPKWYPLQERTEPFDDLLCYKGEMIVGLKFVPPDVTNLHKKGRMSRGSLHVLVKDAKNLTAVKTNGTSDPFCKSYLLPDKGRSSKQKTAVCRRTINPVWNHTFVYEDVSLQELSERSLELTVWDHDRLASNEFLGGLRFNLGSGKHYGKNVDWMDATGREMTLWQSMLERANFWVEGCLTLRPTLDHRSSPSGTLAS